MTSKGSSQGGDPTKPRLFSSDGREDRERRQEGSDGFWKEPEMPTPERPPPDPERDFDFGGGSGGSSREGGSDGREEEGGKEAPDDKDDRNDSRGDRDRDGGDSGFQLWRVDQLRDQHELAERLPAIWARIQSSSLSEKQQFLLDTRQIHRELFKKYTASKGFDFAGVYRGTLGSRVEYWHSFVRVPSSDGHTRKINKIAPKYVRGSMEKFNARLQGFLDKGIHRSNLPEIVDLFHHFLSIHPYADGNGRIARLLTACVANNAGFSVAPSWVSNERPYDSDFADAYDNYRNAPDRLVRLTGSWFH